MKTCNKCGIEKPLDDYYKHKQCSGGRRADCKACVLAQMAEYNARPEVKDQRAEYRAEYYAENRDRESALIAEYKAAKPHIGWESTYRYRSICYGFEPVIERFTRDELIARWGDECVHCGGPFEHLDHSVTPVFLGGAHTIENCRPSCASCNSARNQFNKEDIGKTA